MSDTDDYAYFIKYSETPGGDLNDISDIYKDTEAVQRMKRDALGSDAQPGSVAVIWRAPYDEKTTWRSWNWKRWRAYIKEGRHPKKIDVSAAPIKPQRYLDK